MVIRSYNEVYLNDAKRNLGVATDYLVNACGLPAERVGGIYASSPTMSLFERGDPGVVAGLSGTELGQRLFLEMRAVDEAPPPVRSFPGRSPEYWGGWALAHFQWHWCKAFRWIFARASLSDVLAKYSVYHEMDISRFLEDFMRELASVKTEKNLRRIRRAPRRRRHFCNRHHQEESSPWRLSGVNIRNIQLYEQGVQDINRASAATLASLARPLACMIENLME